jgi:hypothetical protein
LADIIIITAAGVEHRFTAEQVEALGLVHEDGNGGLAELIWFKLALWPERYGNALIRLEDVSSIGPAVDVSYRMVNMRTGVNFAVLPAEAARLEEALWSRCTKRAVSRRHRIPESAFWVSYQSRMEVP